MNKHKNDFLFFNLYLYHLCVSACEDERTLDPLELKLQVVLEAKLGYLKEQQAHLSTVPSF